MKSIRLRCLSLLGICCLAAMHANADNANADKQLQTNKSYYFFNESKGQYLTVSNGKLALANSGKPVTLSQTDADRASSSYTLNIDGQALSTTFQGGVNIGTEQGKWLLKPVEGKSGVYTVSCRDYNAEAAAYIYSSTSGDIATQYAEPTLGGEWKIDEAQCIVLNEAADSYTMPSSVDDAGLTVRLVRKLTLDSWNSLCLPFDITVEQLKEQWGDETEVVELKSFDGKTLHFKKVQSLQAGMPYLVRPYLAPTSTYYEFNNITTFTPDVQQCNQNSIEFVGSFVVTTAPADAYVLSKNKMYWLETSMTMKGFRAYFENKSPNPAPLSFWTIDENPTDIRSVFATGNPVDIYTVDGILVRRQVTSAEGLQKGIYVVEGHKFFVK